MGMVQTLFEATAATDSIFEKVEEVLYDSSWLQGRLEVIGDEGADAYRSLIDWLLVQVHPEYLEPTMAFYEERGPQLKDTVKEPERRQLEADILKALRLLAAVPDGKYVRRWHTICARVRAAA